MGPYKSLQHQHVLMHLTQIFDGFYLSTDEVCGNICENICQESVQRIVLAPREQSKEAWGE